MNKRIGILTSGGDAPGMNAAIRAVVRSAFDEGIEVIGFERGYDGLINDEHVFLDIRSVGDIIQRGGTMLKTARSEEFMTEEGQKRAIETINKNEIDALVVVGGDGTFRGALDLTKKGIVVMGIPGTIDNDMGYTDYTIGFDTAVNTVLSAISNIRDTASAHDRTTIVEVMGRNCGDIALTSGVTGGAEYILIPELPVDVMAICTKISEAMIKKKSHSIIIKAEGVDIPTMELADMLARSTGMEVRTVTLAYLQRGGSPSARDRMLATLTGKRAVDLIRDDSGSRAIGIHGAKIIEMDMAEAIKIKKEADLELLKLIEILSC